MATSRSNRLLVIGLAVFVVGAALVLFLTSRDGGNATPVEQPTGVASPTPNPSASETGPPPNARVPRPVPLPEGYEAVAITMNLAQGVIGLPSPGDRVNLYGVYSSTGVATLDVEIERLAREPDFKPPAGVRLIATNVLVLASLGPNGEFGGGNPTYLLAVDTNIAETVIYATNFESIHATLVHPDAAPSDSDGRSRLNMLNDAPSDQTPPEGSLENENGPKDPIRQAEEDAAAAAEAEAQAEADASSSEGGQ